MRNIHVISSTWCLRTSSVVPVIRPIGQTLRSTSSVVPVIRPIGQTLRRTSFSNLLKLGYSANKQLNTRAMSAYCVTKHQTHLVDSQVLKDIFVPKLPTPNTKAMSTCVAEHQRQLVDSQVFKDIFVPELQTLKKVCERNEMDIRIAGGAVRDILLGQVPHDIDFATTTHPHRMIEIFEKEEIRMLEYGARAIDHGTVSVRINDSVNYEITTTRSDVTTYGRHASVEFHTDWKKDANRRDLTINSMFLGLDGTLYDFFNGYNDLMDRRVLFVGNANDRINEDFLRIMRYFRFYGRIKADPEDHDQETLEVIGKNAEGLKGVAGERIWVELKKIIGGHFADHQIAHIVELGVAEHIGLPVTSNVKEFTKVYDRSAKYDISESTLLAALFADKQEVDNFHARLKVSKQEYTTALFIVEERDSYVAGNIKRYQDMIVDTPDRKLCHQRCVQLAAYMNDRQIYDELQSWAIPKFPFNATVLLNAGVPKGKKIYRGVEMVKQRWKESNFQSTSADLEEYAKSLVKSGELS